MSTRIVVVRMKDIIKKGILILIGVLIIGAIVFFIASDKNETSYIPGTYSSEIILNSDPVVIEVTVDENSILDIAMLNMGETQAVFYPLFEPSFETVREEILKKQSTEIETKENAVTTSVLVGAVEKALDEAKKEKEK